MADGVLVYGDLLGGPVLFHDDSVVPDEVRSVPRDVVAWTQSGRIVDVLVAKPGTMTDGRQRGPRHLAGVTFHLRYETHIIYCGHSTFLGVVVAAAWAQRSVEVVTTKQDDRRLHDCANFLIRELQAFQFFSVTRLHGNVLSPQGQSPNLCKTDKFNQTCSIHIQA